MTCSNNYVCPQESCVGVLSTRLRNVVNTAALLMLCAVSSGATVNLAWDASATDGCGYRLYAQSGTNILRVATGTNLTATLDVVAPGFWSFWATATKDGVESDPSNVLTVEVPRTPEGMRTVAIEYTVTLTNDWAETGFFRLRIP